MQFGEYVRVLHDTDRFNISKQELAAELFNVAGSKQSPVLEETAKSWMSNYRKCRIRNHFPCDKINEPTFINYVEKYIGESWPELQFAFLSFRDETCVIDFETANKDELIYKLSRASANAAHNYILPKITQNPLFPKLKDKYRDAILFLDKVSVEAYGIEDIVESQKSEDDED